MTESATTEQPAVDKASPRPWTAPLRLRFEDSPLGRASIWDAKDYCLILDARRDIARGFVDAVNQSAAFAATVERLTTLLKNAGHPRIPKGEESKRRPCWCNTSLYCVDEPNCIATRAALAQAAKVKPTQESGGAA